MVAGGNMRIAFLKMKTANIIDVNKCDDEFIIDSKLILRLENNELHYKIVQVPATRKRYGRDPVDYTTYIDNVDKVVFLAYVKGQIVGQIILRKNWNKYAYIEDITVDVQFRRQGIGKGLILRAKQWAQEHELAGIMLETQDNNVPACSFYASCGFQLRGFDTHLYKGVDQATDEIALFWYLLFGKESSG